MEDDDRLFIHGRANPQKFGWPIRSSAGESPDPERVAAAARRLGRPVAFVDADGYECELIGAAVGPDGQIAFVESRAKDVGFNQYGANQRHIDVSIRVHLVDSTGKDQSADIESYNPFFGCDVRFFGWVGPTAVLIYREKHWTFACRLGDLWPPRFVKIESRWVINGDTLGYIGHKDKAVRRLRFPDMEPLEPMSIAEANRVGLHPGD
ncbi:hypothetical protein R5W23_005711 [Gemmata sp. JC673]|uniref:Uncharacterized protein n=1 Tax=Gemmata algarum TaxID=2975278 RepID=A0ABU5ETU4_9BACT|nr:hypothetical protein [Gemmata algarum]MDY3558590.1 hypothetical protein [Gemmata algarum]